MPRRSSKGRRTHVDKYPPIRADSSEETSPSKGALVLPGREPRRFRGSTDRFGFPLSPSHAWSLQRRVEQPDALSQQLEPLQERLQGLAGTALKMISPEDYDLYLLPRGLAQHFTSNRAEHVRRIHSSLQQRLGGSAITALRVPENESNTNLFERGQAFQVRLSAPIIEAEHKAVLEEATRMTGVRVDRDQLFGIHVASITIKRQEHTLTDYNNALTGVELPGFHLGPIETDEGYPPFNALIPQVER